jgi:hypothetical protein
MTAGAGTPVRAYSSTVVAPWLAVASAAIGGAMSTGLYLALPGGDFPGRTAGLLAGAVTVLTGLYLATVRLAAGNGRIVFGHGPWARTGRVIPASLVTEAHVEHLSLPQTFGFGIPWDRRTTRMTVRPGPVLALTLSTGEVIRVSTPDPRAALAVIQPGPTRPGETWPAASRPGTEET